MNSGRITMLIIFLNNILIWIYIAIYFQANSVSSGTRTHATIFESRNLMSGLIYVYVHYYIFMFSRQWCFYT